MLLRGSFAAPQPQNTHKRTQKVWLDSRTAPHPVQYTCTPYTSATARRDSFIHSFMSHTQHARNVHAQCGAKPCTHGWTAVCFKFVYVAYVPLFLLRLPSSLPSSSLRRCLLGHVRLPLLCLVTVFGSVLSLWAPCGPCRRAPYGGAGRSDGVDLQPADGLGGGSFGVACAFVRDAWRYFSCAVGRGFVVSFLYVCERFVLVMWAATREPSKLSSFKTRAATQEPTRHP